MVLQASQRPRFAAFSRPASNGRQWLPFSWPSLAMKPGRKRHQTARVGNFYQHILFSVLPCATACSSCPLGRFGSAWRTIHITTLEPANDREEELSHATSQLRTPLFLFRVKLPRRREACSFRPDCCYGQRKEARLCISIHQARLR